MGIVIYASKIKGTGKLLWDLYQNLAPYYKTAFCRTTECLNLKLCQYHDEPKIAVLLAAKQKELTEFLAFQDLLNRFRLIVILPDDNKNTIKKGHSLHPRYLTHVGNDFDWMTAVLKKMLSNDQNGNRNKINRELRV